MRNNELQAKILRLQEENEKIKNQYNCYACGNCEGKEDYINLEKHHKGLRKQFDELAKRNNTLSLRIEELEKENEELKEKIESYICNADCYKYKEANKYRQALEEIRTYINQECKNKQCPQICANCFMGNVLIKVNEVLNDRD